jgi:hypothetical protein
MSILHNSSTFDSILPSLEETGNELGKFAYVLDEDLSAEGEGNQRLNEEKGKRNQRPEEL